ncbi:dienelactone hydrolase family protein [Paraburkholderia xenovorans LB400]|uniref:Lactonase (Box pathway) n=1 Tax=Paraburkholderia xenovorans (strain LB400) TaxID=266265 RepID=Q13GL7_PARXL|nr:alpha/beta hydrolase [Paraburkholderia xenovorans]ABE36772.1 Putative lactonase (box pathway) [Paraburkholderia xenovorans LB400]AIP34955.1 dienelactone hydrolase family protein [Paraburkholderia xenovorans LB400]
MHNPATTATDSELAVLPATATRDPLNIEYQWLNPELSAAPVAVFLHEGLGSIAMWRDWPQTLCDQLGMRGLVYSRPGYGRSTARPHDTKWPVDFMTVQARDVLPALLDTLGVDSAERSRMWVIGHSDGGSIALLYASSFPGELAGAVAIAPHVFVEDISVESIAQAKVAYEQAGLREKLSRYHADVDSAFYGWNDIWLNPAFRTWNIVDTLRAIRCPLLAVQGHDDHYGTMAQIEAIAEQVPHTQLVKLDACGHSPHRDAPEALNRAIITVIRSVAATSHGTMARLD